MRALKHWLKNSTWRWATFAIGSLLALGFLCAATIKMSQMSVNTSAAEADYFPYVQVSPGPTNKTITLVNLRRSLKLPWTNDVGDFNAFGFTTVHPLFGPSPTYTNNLVSFGLDGGSMTIRGNSYMWPFTPPTTNQVLLAIDPYYLQWGAVPNASLANSSITVLGAANRVTVTGSPVSLGGSVAITVPQDIQAGASPAFNGANTTNLPIVASVCIPMGAWFTNNVGDGASLSAASSLSVSNTSDGFAFAHGSFTNCIRTRFSLPWDWDGSTVQIGIQALCTGTNAAIGAQTNAVFAVRAAAIGNADAADSPTFGTAVWTTNHVGTSAYVPNEAITTALTVGNSPSGKKSILWELQRLGNQAGDSITNTSLCVTEVRVYFKRNTRTDYPSATP